jgi:hypothetical protein
MMMATTALFLSLGGGAYAAFRLPRNSVGTPQLRNGAVSWQKLRDGAVTARKVKRHSLLASDFRAGQLPAGPRGATGPKGSTGSAGPRGPRGATGPAGPGYHFVTASGTSGPTLGQAGTYFVVVEAPLQAGASALTGDCGVSVSSGGHPLSAYHGAFDVPPNADDTYSFTGMLVVPTGSAPATTALACTDSSGSPATPSSGSWWVSQVG